MADAPRIPGVILCGGQYGEPPGKPLSDVWSFAPHRGWTELVPKGGHCWDAIATDTDLGVVVAVNEPKTWTLDPRTGAWTRLKTRKYPSDVWGARLAYDEGSRRMILFGGFDGSDLNDQTWALDVQTQTWERMHPSSAPPAQNFHAMTYDPRADRVILVSADPDGGTWAYDYDSDTWTDLAPANPPGPRQYAAVAYAPPAGVVLFGGVDPFGEVPFGDTWVFDFDADAWTHLSGDSPSPRGWHSMAFDAESGQVVMFSGGEERNTDLTDVWFFDPLASRWSRAA